MPLYEYVCEDDGCEFEHLTGADRPARCPKCGGDHLRKKFSTFAAVSSAPLSPTAMPCVGGGCGCGAGHHGACGLN